MTTTNGPSATTNNAATGVDYDTLDRFKRTCQVAARKTTRLLERHGIEEYEWSRGESAYLMKLRDGTVLGHVNEGLGTKNLVADGLYAQQGGRTFYENIAQDTVAMIVNDLITLGALPIAIHMHLAVGHAAWFDLERRCQELIDGWVRACELSGCAWGMGETPALRNNVDPHGAVLSGSADGIVYDPVRNIINPANLQPGDQIIMCASTGIHANGATTARDIAAKLPQGYLTPIPGGQTYGEALLQPTTIYVPLIDECFRREVPIHYAVHISGHGWRKLMRAPQPFTYRIRAVPQKSLPIFRFVQENGPKGVISDWDAYASFNMGAGFALMVPSPSLDEVLRAAEKVGIYCWHAGSVEAGEKKVVIEPLGITYEESTLALR